MQGVVPQSTTEAEYMAITKGFNAAQWLGGFVGELKVEKCVPIVFCDSQSTIDKSMHQNCYSQDTFEIKFHYIRDTIEKRKLILHKVQTSDNLADILTKPIATLKFKHYSNLIGCY